MVHHLWLSRVQRIAQRLRLDASSCTAKSLETKGAVDWPRLGVHREDRHGLSGVVGAGEDIRAIFRLLEAQRDRLGVPGEKLQRIIAGTLEQTGRRRLDEPSAI